MNSVSRSSLKDWKKMETRKDQTKLRPVSISAGSETEWSWTYNILKIKKKPQKNWLRPV